MTLHPSLLRFLKYASIGGSTFVFDLGLLFLLTDVFHVYYVFSAAIGFLVAVSCNYVISRKFVFKGTLRSAHAGYVIFLLIAGIGLGTVTGLMYVFVSILGLHYLLSRIFIAGIVGMWNYLMNLYVNFKVAGNATLYREE